MRQVICLIGLLVVMAGSITSFAAQPSEVTTLEKTIVTATRYPEKAERVTAGVSVISRDEIKKADADNLPDLLKSELGLELRDWFGNSRNSSVGMRGINMESASMNTVLMVDGRRLDDVDMAGYDWTEIPLSRVERIEIIRGSGSVLYGDNSVGGAINIITRKGDQDKKGSTTVRCGSYQAHSVETEMAGENNGLFYSIDGTYSYTDGYRTNSYLRYKSAGATVGYDFEDWSLELSGGVKQDRYGQPSALMESDLISHKYSRRDVEVDDNTDNSIPYAETESCYARLTPKFYPSDALTLLANITTEHKEPKSVNYWVNTWPVVTEITNKLDNEKDKFGILPQAIIDTEYSDSLANRLTFGYDRYLYGLTARSNNWIYETGALDAWYSQDVDRDQYAYYIQDALTVAEKVVLKGGCRYEKSTFTSHFNNSNSTEQTTTHAFDETASEAGISYLFGEKSNLYYNYSRGFRFPKSDEFMSLMTGEVNEELIPQKSDHHQLGVNWQVAPKLEVNLCLFQMDTKGEIYYDTTLFQNLNYDGRIRRDGIESGFKAGLLDWLSIKGTHTLTAAGIETGLYGGNSFPGVPKHTYDLALLFDLGQFSGSTSFRGASNSYFISDWDNQIQGRERKHAGFMVMDMKGSYAYNGYDFFLGVNNVLDEEYDEYAVEGFNNDTWVYEPAYYPSPGRNLFAGITYSY
ncbi:MAG: TonB-dependent receptor [Pseudomonadota bacterium]